MGRPVHDRAAKPSCRGFSLSVFPAVPCDNGTGGRVRKTEPYLFRFLANLGIAVGASMIMFGPNASAAELSRVAVPVFGALHVVEMFKRRARRQQIAEYEDGVRAEQKRTRELLGL